MRHTRLILRRDIDVHLAHRTRGEKYASEVDCRLLFLGDRHLPLLRAYRHAVELFTTFREPRELVRALGASREIAEFYEVQQHGEHVAIEMRDAIFANPCPSPDIPLELEVSGKRETFRQSLSLDALRSLGHLLPLLHNGTTRPDIVTRLSEHVTPREIDRACELLELLCSHGFITEEAREPANHFSRPARRPRLTFLGHTGLLLQSTRAAIVIDPIFLSSHGLPVRARDAAKLPLDAIFCSHSHWDHCNLETLLWFDKTIPVVIPKVSTPSVFNPPMSPLLRCIGFREIREIELWQRIEMQDIEVVPVPFHGEEDEPGALIDHYTYVLQTGSLRVYGGVDSFRDGFGDMKPVLRKIQHEYRPNIALLPISNMRYRYRDGGVNGFCRYLDGVRVDGSLQYTAAPEDAAEWASILADARIVPYATFTFSRWRLDPLVVALRRVLRRRKASERLCFLRPLDSIHPGMLQHSTFRRTAGALKIFLLSYLEGFMRSRRRVTNRALNLAARVSRATE